MRVFLTVLVLFLSLQSLTKADDIRDFEIEGISIGDSLLDYFTKEEIIEATRENQYEDKDGKFIDVNFFDDTVSFLKTYEGLLISYKKNDKKYKIYSLGGGIFFDDKDINQCLEMQKIVDKDLSDLFKKAERYETKKKYKYDDTGKSFVHFITYYLDSGDEVEVTCYEFADHFNRKNYLLVTVDKKEFKDWLE